MKRTVRSALVIGTLLAGACLLAPEAIGQPSQEATQQVRIYAPADAHALQAADQFDEAIVAWESIAERDPGSGEAWFNLGYCLHAAGRLEEALAIHEVASRFERYQGIALYNLGCAHALLEQPDDAFDALFASRAAGFDVASYAGTDADLTSLRDDPRFSGLISGTRAQGSTASRRSGPSDIMQQLHDAVTQLQHMLEYQWPQVKQQIMYALEEAAHQAQHALEHVKYELENNEKLAGIARMIQQKLAERSGSQSEQRPVAPPRVSSPGAQEATPPVTPPAVSAAPPSVSDAMQLQNQGRWKDAIAIYEAIIAVQPENVDARFGHAYCLHMNGDYERAIEAHKKAATYPPTRGIANYNLACAYALTGKPAQAIEALYESRASGFDLSQHIHHDSDLDSLRDDDRFKALIRELGDDGADAR